MNARKQSRENSTHLVAGKLYLGQAKSTMKFAAQAAGTIFALRGPGLVKLEG
jgi:hypothetical protein